MKRLQILLIIIGVIYFVDEGTLSLKSLRINNVSTLPELVLSADPGESVTEENESPVYLFSSNTIHILPGSITTATCRQPSLTIYVLEVSIPPPRA